MQDSKTDQEKYAEFRIHDYLGDLKFGAGLLETVDLRCGHIFTQILSSVKLSIVN